MRKFPRTLRTSIITKIVGIFVIVASLFIFSAAISLLGNERIIPGLIGIAVSLAIFIFGYQRMFARLKVSQDKIAEIKTILPRGKTIDRKNISYCQFSKDYGGAQYATLDFYSHEGEKIYTISDGFFFNACSTMESWAEQNEIPLLKEDGTPKLAEKS